MASSRSSDPRARRPDPEALLARARAEEAAKCRGKLKVFFGASPGVGKTYAMLAAARARRAEGVDLVVGVVETHGRSETNALLADLEVLPRRPVEYRGMALSELDLDAALARTPTLILVDELAHSNAPGSRHAKRWQDVEELLDAGIDVYTTVNVQHLESLNDVVAQITGVAVRETVPDRLIDRADEVELVDLAPDDLQKRLREGKVYIPEQAERAAEGFFRKGNLIALRELALRRTAERVDEQMLGYMRDHGIARTWPVTERILVSVSPSPFSARLVRATRRMATGLRAEWHAVYVESAAQAKLPAADRARVAQNLLLAERLGAQTAVLHGDAVADELIGYARSHNVTKIVVGKPTHPRWRDIAYGSLLDDIVRRSGPIDVYVITGERGSAEPVTATLAAGPRREHAGYPWAIGIVAACTLCDWFLVPRNDLANVIMVYLLGTVLVSARFGHGAAVFASVLSVAAFDFFFVPPFHTFAVGDLQYVLTFAIMLGVALAISGLTARIRTQAEASSARERRTAALYALSRELTSTRDASGIAEVAARHVRQVFEGDAAVFLPGAHGALEQRAASPEGLAPSDRELAVARWAFDHARAAGSGTDTLPSAEALYLPLVGTGGTIGVLAVRPTPRVQLTDPSRLHQLETFANQTALALERARLAEETHAVRLEMEAEQVQSSLLSSVSHDLRTPLASITGATSTLLDPDAQLDAEMRRELTQTAYEEAERLSRLVQNLLDMTQLEAGTIRVKKEWQPLDEIVGVALNRLERRLSGRPVLTHVPQELPAVPIDGVLFEQVLINLLDNALKYTPTDSPIEVSASQVGDAVVVEVADRGPGFRPDDIAHLFDKFYRAERTGGGAGLGLAIARGIVLSHGGRIEAENRAGGGALFRFTIPLEGVPVAPRLPAGEAAGSTALGDGARREA